MSNGQKFSNPDIWNVLLAQASSLNPAVAGEPLLMSIGEMNTLAHERVKKARQEEKGDVVPTARNFFANHGIDFDNQQRLLAKLDLSSVKRSKDVSVLDLDGFLQQKSEEMIKGTLDDHLTMATEEMEANFRTGLEENWYKTQESMMESFGYHNRNADIDMSQSSTSAPGRFASEGQRSASQRSAVHSNRHISAGTFRYACVMQELNEHLHSKQRMPVFPLCSKFTMAEKAIYADSGNKGLHHNQIMEAWKTIQKIVECTPKLKQGIFRDAHRNKDPRLQRHLTRIIREISELLYRNHVNDTVVSGYIDKNKIKAFVKQKLSLNSSGNRWHPKYEDLLEGTPLWPVVFYLFRCGKVKAAAECLDSGSGSFEAFRQGFSAYLSDPNSVITDQMMHEYNVDIKDTSRDQFKIAMYNLIGRFEANPNNCFKPNEIFLEDYIWIRLTTLSKEDEPFGSFSSQNKDSKGTFASLSLEAWQQQVREAKSDFSTEKPFSYFNLLLFSQQFELAIDYLLRDCSGFEALATHFAICLNYYGLLRRSYGVRQNSDKSIPTIDFRGLVGKYIARQNLIHTPKAGFNYAMSLYEPKVGDSMNIFKSTMADLLINAKEADLKTLVRDDPDEVTLWQNGYLFKYIPKLAVDILHEAGEIAQRRGDAKKAIKIFKLSKNYLAVAKILARECAHVVGRPDSEHRRALFRDLHKFMTTISTRTDQSPQAVKGLQTVEALRVFYDLYNSGSHKFDAASAVIYNLKVFPKEGNPPFHEYYDRMGTFDEAVRTALLNAIGVLQKIIAHKIEKHDQNKHDVDPRRYTEVQKLQVSGHTLKMFVNNMEFSGREVKNNRNLFSNPFGCQLFAPPTTLPTPFGNTPMSFSNP